MSGLPSYGDISGSSRGSSASGSRASGGGFGDRRTSTSASAASGGGGGGGSRSRVNPDKEIKLFRTKEEREAVRGKADLYAIIIAANRLEKLYTRGSLPGPEYEGLCRDLIGHAENEERSLVHSRVITSARDFVAEARINAAAGVYRVLESRVPATAESSHSGDAASAFGDILSLGVAFVTIMDALEMDRRSKEDLFPLLEDIAVITHRVPVPPDFEGFQAIKTWLSNLRELSITDEINEDQKRQMSFDLQRSYEAVRRLFNTGPARPGGSASGGGGFGSTSSGSGDAGFGGPRT